MIVFGSLIFAFLILILISITLFRNVLYFKAIHDFDEIETNSSTPTPLVSICIPARNEERSINGCVRSALMQTYANIEVIVLDDESSDATPKILKEIKSNLKVPLKVIKGKPKPENWLGKNWACHQLGNTAKGEIIVFIDSDVTLELHTMEALVERFNKRNEIGLISIWPEQILVTFWENIIVPMIYYALLGFLFLRYTEKPPRWMPNFLKRAFAPVFSAACGQFMAFRSAVYQQIGGHEAVKNEIVEDVELARLVIKSNVSVLNLSGKDSVYCRMYHNYEEIKQGFRKNFLAGFRNNIPFFVLSGLIHLFAFIIPFFVLILYTSISFWPGAILAYCIVLIPVFHRFWFNFQFNWKMRYIPLHFLGVLWFNYLGFIVLKDYFLKRKPTWKDREI